MYRLMNTSLRRGFTLVELLVVIVIIGILAALTSVAVISALRTAERTVITTEINELAAAIEAYKSKYGSYPPSDPGKLKSHLQTVFTNMTDVGSVPTNLNQAQILVYCLRGYSKDARKPVTGAGERDNFFPFKEERLSGTGNQTYLAPKCKDTPYVYFNCSNYTKVNPPTTDEKFTGSTGTAARYITATGTPRVNANAQSFQIICAGQDGNFGADSLTKTFPAGTGYNAEDNDNLTNFTTGPLGDQRP